MHTASPVSTAQIWMRHAWPALLLFPGAAAALALPQLDLTIADTFFYDASSGWIGAHSWWINDVIHTGGRWAVRITAFGVLALWSTSFFAAGLRDLRRPAGYFLSALVLTIGVVGLLKVVTNVDCPWDLAEFGGRYPYLGLFLPRPESLRHAHCFPAAHASSGYAFMALYFAMYERSRRLALLGLAVGVLLGLLFGIAQQSRGAHFVSHDLWSAWFAWMIPLTLYVFAFKGQLYSQPAARSFLKVQGSDEYA